MLKLFITMHSINYIHNQNHVVFVFEQRSIYSSIHANILQPYILIINSQNILSVYKYKNMFFNNCLVSEMNIS